MLCGSQALEWRCNRKISMASLNARVERRPRRNSIHLSCFTLIHFSLFCIVAAFCPSPRLLLTSLTFPPFHPLNLSTSLFHPSRHTFILLESAPLSSTGRDSGALVLLSIWYVPEHHNQSPSAFAAVLIQNPGLTLLPCFFQALRINFPSTQAQGQHTGLVSRSSYFLVHSSVDTKPCRSHRR